jgi:hypothetical protein
MPTDENEFSVVRFFATGEHEYVRRRVSAREAVEAARDYSSSVAAQFGVVTKVVITDGGDHTNFMWEYGRGIVYPRLGADGKFHP